MSKRARKGQKKVDEEEEEEEEKVTNTSNGKSFSFTWKKEGSLIYGDCGTKPSDKVLSFDMVE